jgi:IPT/TIG domain
MEGIKMRNSLLVAALLACAVPAPLRAQAALPLIRDVQPASGTYGDLLTVTGENLDPETVAALYLTDGKNDTKVAMQEQTGTSIKFQIPAGIGSGRFALMVLTKGKTGEFIEEPVKVTIEPPSVRPAS